jgi:hypothetical protein
LTDEEFDREPVQLPLDAEGNPQPSIQETTIENSILFGKTNIFRSVIEGSVVGDSLVATSNVKRSDISTSEITGNKNVSGSTISGSMIASSDLVGSSTVIDSDVVSSNVQRSNVEGCSRIQQSRTASASIINSTLINKSAATSLKIDGSSLDATTASGYHGKENGEHTDQITGSTLTRSKVEFGTLTNVVASDSTFINSHVKHLDFSDTTLDRVTATGLRMEDVPKPHIATRIADADISTSHSEGQPYLAVYITKK